MDNNEQIKLISYMQAVEELEIKTSKDIELAISQLNAIKDRENYTISCRTGKKVNCRYIIISVYGACESHPYGFFVNRKGFQTDKYVFKYTKEFLENCLNEVLKSFKLSKISYKKAYDEIMDNVD